MPDNNMRAYAQLLARARAAIETPGDLDDAARSALTEDIGAFEDCLTAGKLPWPIDIHVGSIEHRNGTNQYAALTREALMAEIAEYCREWWADIEDQRDPEKLGDETVAESYFEGHPSEYLVTDRVRVEPSSIDLRGSDVETGRYCVLTTAHLSTATATLMDRWCSDAAPDRPINLANTIYGWFVPARQVDEATRKFLPVELLAAMQYARQFGFDHILFDCDAGSVDDLPEHDW